jgi:hypothetical protein
MADACLANADGDFLIVPQLASGALQALCMLCTLHGVRAARSALCRFAVPAAKGASARDALRIGAARLSVGSQRCWLHCG